MVNKLSDLAEFLHDDSLPLWLKREIDSNREAIFSTLGRGEEYVIPGPNGEEVKISPKAVAA
jgi:hypothetical protein